MPREIVIPEEWVEDLFYEPEALGYLIFLITGRTELRYIPPKVMEVLRNAKLVNLDKEGWNDKSNEAMMTPF